MAFKNGNLAATFVRAVGEYRCANWQEQSAVPCKSDATQPLDQAVSVQAKFGRDLPGPVRAPVHRDSREDQAAPELEAAMVPRGLEILATRKLEDFASRSDAGARLNGHQTSSGFCAACDFIRTRGFFWRLQRSATTDCTLMVLPSRCPTTFARSPATRLRLSRSPSRR